MKADLDPVAIRAHAELLHRLAASLADEGKLVIAGFGEDFEGRPLRPKITHVEIGDVDGMVAAVTTMARDQYRNVYTSTAVFRKDLPTGKKGEETDIVGVLGLVGDFDDADAARWPERLPLPPSYVLESSAGRFQSFHLFNEPALPGDAKPVATRLKAFAGCDHGTVDLSHVWRIPGTLNWPSAKKIAAGRPREPQIAKVVKACNGALGALEALAAVLPEAEPGKKTANGHDETTIDLETLSPIVVELLVHGTLNGKPVKKRGPAFARIIHAFRAGGHSFSAALATLIKYPGGGQAKYGARIAVEARRMWEKIELRESYKQKGFICGAKGNPLPNVANAITALRLSPKWQDSLEYDLFAEKLLYDDEPWESINDILAAEWLQHNEVNVSPHVAGQAAYAVGRDNKFHPVRDYLAGLVWDGTARIDTWLIQYLGVAVGDAERTVAEQDYLIAVGSKFLIGCVARVMRPGCKADCALVLEGPQGILKSTAIMALLPSKSWFTDELADLGSKDAALQLAGRWIIEWSELDSYSRAEVARVKAYMSRQEDKFRPPYAAKPVERPRQCCFIGTTNQSEYLRDETGARRFWPARCGKIEIEALKRDRDQLWAEALVRFNKGETWWLDADVEKQAKVEQAARRVEDPWEKLIAKAIATNECVTINAVLNKALSVPIERQDQTAANRVARCLRALGWKRKQAGKDGEFTIYAYHQTIKRGDWVYEAEEPNG